MEKERSKLELWLIVERNFNRIYDGFTDQKGLCNVVNFLCLSENLISWSELVILKRTINEYKKARNIPFFGDPYIWDKEARKPRRMFIQNQILKELRNGTLQT